MPKLAWWFPKGSGPERQAGSEEALGTEPDKAGRAVSGRDSHSDVRLQNMECLFCAGRKLLCEGLNENFYGFFRKFCAIQYHPGIYGTYFRFMGRRFLLTPRRRGRILCVSNLRGPDMHAGAVRQRPLTHTHARTADRVRFITYELASRRTD